MKKDLRYIKLVFIVACLSCNKDAFLDKKPNTGIIIPSTLSDLRGMLDNTNVFDSSPGIGEVSADNYYLTSTIFQSQTDIIRNAYTWASDIYGSTRTVEDWSRCYTQIVYANIALEQLASYIPSTADNGEYINLKGTALFDRAFAHYNLVANFAAAFDSVTADTDLGIPIRITSGIHDVADRSSVAQVYESVISDLNGSIPLLSETVSATNRNRPNKPAAYALLSRIYLSMRKYSLSSLYADSSLNLYNKLLNYNTISTSATTPFDKFQDESMFHCSLTNYAVLSASSTSAYVDTLLYASYSANDLRRVIFFRTISGTNMGIKRGYSGLIYGYGGLAVDEVYLNRAECEARAGNITDAMNDLNTLLAKRWKTGTYINLTATSTTDAIQKILIERRKQLLWRGLRWIDLKRFNKEGQAIELKRILAATTYKLAPNSSLYVLPIPDDEISNSGIKQNPR